MNATTFALLKLALAFYNVGTIWAHELDIFRTWRMIDRKGFHAVKEAHWRRLPYWIFPPVAAAFLAGVGLVWLHPAGFPI